MLSPSLHHSATFSYAKQRKIATDGVQSMKDGTVWRKHSFRIGTRQGNPRRRRTYVSLIFWSLFIINNRLLLTVSV